VAKTINLYQAKTSLSRLVEQAAAGEEIVICKAGKPKARLVALKREARAPRKLGLWKGKIWVSEDLDEPIPEEWWNVYSDDPERDPLNEPLGEDEPSSR
jgi:prevent-host-death family protein